MTKRSPAFQFYVNDYLSDINVQLMTAEEEGAYLRLLCFCWQDSDLSLPNNDEQLIVLSKLSKGGSTTMPPAVKKCFIPHPTKDGYITHKRLVLEAEKQRSWREKSAAGGKKSAENKRNSKGGSRVVQPKGYSSTSSSLSSSSSKKEKIIKKKVACKIPEDFCLDDKLIQFAKDRGMGDSEIKYQFEKFIAHWQAKGEVRESWPATWRTWVLNWQGWQKGKPAKPSGGRNKVSPSQMGEVSWSKS